MTATIHTLHGEIQSPGDQPNYWDFVHKSVMATISTVRLGKAFAELVIDESMRNGNTYLAQEAQTFIECLEKLEKGRSGK